MGIRSWLHRLTEDRGSIENPSTPLSSYVPSFSQSLGPTASGVNVTVEKALTQVRVWRAINCISDTVASLPLKIYRDGADGREEARTHPFYRKLQLRPNDHLSSYTFRQMMVAYLYIYGNAYALITRDGNNQPSSLLLILPDCVRRTWEDGKVWYAVKESGGGEVMYPPERIIHVPGFTLDGVCGLSTAVYAARNSIGLALAAEENTSRFFSNGSRLSGVLKHPGKLSGEAAARMAQSWNSIQGGLENAYKTAMLEEGTDYARIGVSMQEAQAEEMRRFQTEEIAAAFGIPPVFIGDHTHSTFSNNEQQDLHFSKHTINPIVTRIEQELNWKLFGSTQYFCEFNLDGLERGDYAGRVEGTVRGIQGGLMTPNEGRKLFNLPPMDGGDELYLQQNMSDLQNLGEMQGQPMPGGGQDDEEGKVTWLF